MGVKGVSVQVCRQVEASVRAMDRGLYVVKCIHRGRLLIKDQGQVRGCRIVERLPTKHVYVDCGPERKGAPEK